jgi:hypothetical protein
MICGHPKLTFGVASPLHLHFFMNSVVYQTFIEAPAAGWELCAGGAAVYREYWDLPPEEEMGSSRGAGRTDSFRHGGREEVPEKRCRVG